MHHNLHPKYRPDIDGLRAVAILIVVIYHAFPSKLTGGFIGVDIFFVISGFLISNIIFKSIEKGGFTFTDFYIRRANRIFPSLVLVLASCFLFGWFSLLPIEYKELGKYLAAGAGFVSNIVLWSDTGYFDIAAELKPLLHLWSLGIEEQFYVVWPVVLVLAYKWRLTTANIFPIIILGIVVSFTWNIVNAQESPSAVFYLLMPRFWQLLMGSLLAYIRLYSSVGLHKVPSGYYRFKSIIEGCPLANSAVFSNITALFATFLIVFAVVIIAPDQIYTGAWALLPTLGALLLIATPSAWINRKVLSHKVMVWFGLISYPLYLWHWPLLSFARIIEQETPSHKIRIYAVILSIILAWLTYYFVERPVRLGAHKALKAIVFSSILFVLGLIGWKTYKLNGLGFRSELAYLSKNSMPNWMEIRKQFSSECPFKFRKYSSCYLFSGDAKENVLLIGDSHAEHFVPGFMHYVNSDFNVGALILNGGCPPLLGIERLAKNNNDPVKNYGETGASCAEVNNVRFKYVLSSPAKTVIISHAAIEYNQNDLRTIKSGNFKYSYKGRPMGHADAFNLALRDTVSFLISNGKDVILFQDIPGYSRTKSESCMTPARPLTLTGIKSADCTITLKEAEKQQNNVVSTYNDLKSLYPENIFIFKPLKYLCTQDTCSMRKGEKLVYRDDDHLSVWGSNFLVEKFMGEYRAK